MVIMQLKSVEYYEFMDLDKASREIKLAGERRDTLEVFGDAINAVYFRIKKEEITVSKLQSILGKPDSEIDLKDVGCVLEYKWQDEHGGTKFISSTRFLVKDDMVVGLYKEENE
jgi:hypothetical protein